MRTLDVPLVESAFSGVEVEEFVVDGIENIAPSTVLALAIPPELTIAPVAVVVLSVVLEAVTTPDTV
jgi:hypothetical protein